MTITPTRHANARASQRGFRRDDPELIRQYGTEIPDRDCEVYLMRRRDIAWAIGEHTWAIGEHKRTIQRLKSLSSRTIVLAGDDLVTGYRASRRNEKALLRRA